MKYFKKTKMGWQLTLPGIILTSSLGELELMLFCKVAVGYHRRYGAPTLYTMLCRW